MGLVCTHSTVQHTWLAIVDKLIGGSPLAAQPGLTIPGENGDPLPPVLIWQGNIFPSSPKLIHRGSGVTGGRPNPRPEPANWLLSVPRPWSLVDAKTDIGVVVPPGGDFFFPPQAWYSSLFIRERGKSVFRISRKKEALIRRQGSKGFLDTYSIAYSCEHQQTEILLFCLVFFFKADNRSLIDVAVKIKFFSIFGVRGMLKARIN